MYDMRPPEISQLAAERAAISVSGTLIALNRVSRVYPGPVSRGMQALGAALRQLEQATPVLQRPPPPAVVIPARPRIALVRAERRPVIITPATVLEERVEPRSRRDPALVQQDINGCKALLLEIIRRAAYDWVLYRESSRLLYKKMAEEAFIWLFEEGLGHPDWTERIGNKKHITAFTSICDALDLDPLAVRSRIRGLTTRHVMNVGRPAEYRRHDCSRLEEASVSAIDIEEHAFEHVSYEALEDEMHGGNRGGDSSDY